MDNLHPNHHHHHNTSATQRVNHPEFGINSDLKSSSNSNNHSNRIGATAATTNSTSTSTSLDHSSTQTPVSTLSCSSTPAAAPVDTSQPSGPTSQSNNVGAGTTPPNYHYPHPKPFPTPCRPINVLPGTKQPSSAHASVNAIITSDPFGNGITIKREVPDVGEPVDVKPFANGPLSPSKRSITELNGHSQNNNLPFSQTHFTPISPPSPKSSVNGASSSLGQPAQQQVVAPVSNPKEKFGQARIGSQTLFTPYATTAITRVRSPLGAGGPPTVSSGSQSSATTVIQPESPKEPLVPIGSPYSYHHAPQPQQPRNPQSASPQHNHQHPSSKHNQISHHHHHNHPHPHHHHHHQHHPHHHQSRPGKQSSTAPAVVSSGGSSNSNNSGSHSNSSSRPSDSQASSKGLYNPAVGHFQPPPIHHQQQQQANIALAPYPNYIDHQSYPTVSSAGLATNSKSSVAEVPVGVDSLHSKVMSGLERKRIKAV